MNLFYREYGSGEPLIILHGLMGSSDNWATHAKVFAEHYHVFIPDQRNHGQSFHSHEFNYDLLASDLAEFVERQATGPVSLIGHSMGGKVVMQYTLQNPQNVKKLIVVDMAPKNYRVDYELIFTALNAVDLKTVTSRSEAERIVSGYIDDFGLRQFLLKNLTRSDNGYRWKANLKSIQENIQQMGLWTSISNQYNGPALFISGDKSGYVKEADHATICNLFTQAMFKSLNAGHWLHAEKPNEFMASTISFLNKEG